MKKENRLKFRKKKWITIGIIIIETETMIYITVVSSSTCRCRGFFLPKNFSFFSRLSSNGIPSFLPISLCSFSPGCPLPFLPFLSPSSLTCPILVNRFLSLLFLKDWIVKFSLVIFFLLRSGTWEIWEIEDFFSSSEKNRLFIHLRDLKTKFETFIIFCREKERYKLPRRENPFILALTTRQNK